MKLNPYAGAWKYFLVFRRHIGRRMYLVFGLAIVAALAEGVGITLLLPLLATLDMGLGAAENVPAPLMWVVETLGVSGSMLGILLLIGVVFVLKALLLFGYHAYSSILHAQLQVELKGRLFDACREMSYGYYITRNTGHFVNVLNGQAEGLFRSFSNYKSFLSGVIQAAAYVGFAFLIAWQMALALLVFGALLLSLFTVLNNYVRQLSQKTALEASQLNKALVQSLQAFKYLTSTQKMARLGAKVKESVHRLASYSVHLGIWGAVTGTLREPLALLFIIAMIAVHVGVLGQPLAPIIVAILLLYRGMNAILGVQSAWQYTMGSIGSVEMVELELEGLHAHREENGARVLGPLQHQIELKNVSFSYKDELGNALSDISLTIPARATVAFVGESGAGKSTLIDLLTLLLKPQQGELLIDGVPGREVELASWRSQIGYVSQETVIFDDSIAANIALADIDPADTQTLARVHDAARKAHLAHFIDTLPEGYHTLVGDRGVLLSGGQRQRLFIARELFKEPNLLILDEATSALDTESEREIQRSIDELRGSLCVVIIAHRLSTIRNVDRVFVLQSGRLLEQGRYDELTEVATSRFRRMVDLQALR